MSKRILFRTFASRLLLALVPLAICIYLVTFRNNPTLDDPVYKHVLAELLACQPTPVSVSPDGKYVLTKTVDASKYNLSVIDRGSGHIVARSLSKCTQLALTWRPDSQAIAFQQVAGNERPLYVFDIRTSTTKIVGAPVSHTALPPLRWDPAGTRLAYFQSLKQSDRGRLLIITPLSSNSPIPIAEGLSYNIDFVWAPDGASIAVADQAEPGTISILNVKTKDRFRIQTSADDQIQELAWSPNGRSLLATIRSDRDEYFRLKEVDLQTRRFSSRAEFQGNVYHPFWLPDSDSFLYHVASNGVVHAVLGNRALPESGRIGQTRGVFRITSVTSDGRCAYGRYSGPTRPPVLCEISLNDCGCKIIYISPRADAFACPEPEFISFSWLDGTSIPAYYWRAVRSPSHSPCALISVHGGSHLETLPVWQAYIHLLTAEGCDVIEVNQRGSSGYGQRFEQMSPDPLDIVAAWVYVLTRLKISPHRIYVVGTSTGAGLAAAAISHGEEIGGLVLLSWIGSNQNFERRVNRTFPIIEFHGGLDVITSAADAHESLERFFSFQREPECRFRWHVFEKEGHNFYDIRSSALVYWEILKFIQQE